MIRKHWMILAGVSLGAAWLATSWLGPDHDAPQAVTGAASAHEQEGDEHEEESGQEGEVRLTAEQIEAAGIGVAEIGGGPMARHVALPGTIAANADQLARVTARVAGTIAAVHTRLGDTVAAGEMLAAVESAEIAEAKGGYLAALRTAELARVTFEREQRLWQRRISAEQDYLKARTEHEEARIRLDLARQQLSALGLSSAEVEALPQQPVEALRRQEVRAPIVGRVTAQAAVLGAPVAADTELFTIADLSSVWVEMAVPPEDLAFVKEGLEVRVEGEGDIAGEGRIVFVSPVLDSDTRSARAVIELANPDGLWRPGGFVTAGVASQAHPVEVLLPRAAVQEMDGESVVFVRTAEGFERRDIALGLDDQESVEVVSGLKAGERVAVDNAYVLRAELAKGEAGDDD